MRLAASREPSPAGCTMASIVPRLQYRLQASSMSVVAWRERSVQVFRGTANEEGDIVNDGNFGDVVHGRRVAQGL